MKKRKSGPKPVKSGRDASGAHLSETQKWKLPLTVARPELLVDGSDQVFRRLVHGLFTFLALHEAIRDSYAAHVGLGGIQYTILQSIRHLSQRQAVNVRDVADHLRLSGSFITVETAKLQDMGLLEKKQASDDRRRVSLKVTKKGMEIFDQLAPMQCTVNAVQFGCLSAVQFHELVPMVDDLIASSQDALTLLHYLKGSDPNYRSARIADPPRLIEIERKRSRAK